MNQLNTIYKDLLILKSFFLYDRLQDDVISTYYFQIHYYSPLDIDALRHSLATTRFENTEFLKEINTLCKSLIFLYQQSLKNKPSKKRQYNYPINEKDILHTKHNTGTLYYSKEVDEIRVIGEEGVCPCKGKSPDPFLITPNQNCFCISKNGRRIYYSHNFVMTPNDLKTSSSPFDMDTYEISPPELDEYEWNPRDKEELSVEEHMDIFNHYRQYDFHLDFTLKEFSLYEIVCNCKQIYDTITSSYPKTRVSGEIKDLFRDNYSIYQPRESVWRKFEKDNNIKIDLRDLQTLKSLNNDFLLDETINDSAEITPKERHGQIFKDEGFEIWKSLFESLEIGKSSRTDVRFMYEKLKELGHIHSTVNKKSLYNWISKEYKMEIGYASNFKETKRRKDALTAALAN